MHIIIIEREQLNKFLHDYCGTSDVLKSIYNPHARVVVQVILQIMVQIMWWIVSLLKYTLI
jgi:hypothetical protein